MRARAFVILWVAVLAGCSVAPTEAGSQGFTLDRHDDRVEIALDGRPFTAFHFHSKWDKPFLFPIRTQSGLVISRGWPVEPRPGDVQDHPWHRGIWYGHGDINGEDFWREKPDKSTARLVLEGEPKTAGGGTGSLQATLAMVGSKGNRLGTISEMYEFRRLGRHVALDAAISIRADRGAPLRFGDSDDGGFGFRLASEFREDHGAELMNSDRLTGSAKIWGKRAKWVKYEAAIQGKRAGLVLFDHPSNLRHPAGWHARGYSLCSANPFAEGSFANNKSIDGSYTLPAGETLVLRYRAVIYDGALTADAADRLYADYAQGLNK